jgi:hypothetical protein
MIALGANAPAVLGMVRGLAQELAARGITCNAIVPGIIGTEAFHLGNPTMNERIANRTVFKRPGEPQDIANAIAFLCSDLASYVTGVALTVVASSAEGLAASVDLLRRGHSLAELKELNIDAAASWAFKGLRIDDLPRSMWYNPQHSFACALGLVALPVAIVSGVRARTSAIILAGLGLGLAIAKATVEAHHGTLTAASSGRGQGATFTIELPLD